MLAGALVLAVAVSGCPLVTNGSNSGGTGKSNPQLTTIISMDEPSLAGALAAHLATKANGGSPVPVEDIESLELSITEVAVHYAGDDGGGDRWITLFPSDSEDPIRINIMDVGELGRVLTVDELPAGKYTKIAISIADPHLVLKSGEETDNVQLTANGRMFVSEQFTLEDGFQGTLEIAFTSLHLVEAGNSGKFVLTPQLRADVTPIAAVETSATGIIQNLDGDSFELALDGDGAKSEDIIEVEYSDPGTMVYLLDGTEGTAADLENGQEVEVTGLYYPEGPDLPPLITATSISIITVDATIAGIVTNNAYDPGVSASFAVDVSGTDILVNYLDAAEIYLPGEVPGVDTPTGTPADLADGQSVEVSGRLHADDTMDAVVIAILAVPADETGTIASLDNPNAGFFNLLNGTTYQVDYSSVQEIYLPGEVPGVDTPTGTPGDLADGQSVEVSGRLFADDTIEADVIVILAVPADQTGTVANLDSPNAGYFDLENGTTYQVDYSSVVEIYLPGEVPGVDTPTGTSADLVDAAEVQVLGLEYPNTPPLIVADTIVIVSLPAP